MSSSDIAKRIKNFRVINGLNQKQLAALAHVSLSTIQNYERGITAPNAEKLNILSKIFNCDIEELIADPKKTAEAQAKHKKILNISSNLADREKSIPTANQERKSLNALLSGDKAEVKAPSQDQLDSLKEELLNAYREIASLRTRKDYYQEQLITIGHEISRLIDLSESAITDESEKARIINALDALATMADDMYVGRGSSRPIGS